MSGSPVVDDDQRIVKSKAEEERRVCELPPGVVGRSSRVLWLRPGQVKRLTPRGTGADDEHRRRLRGRDVSASLRGKSKAQNLAPFTPPIVLNKHRFVSMADAQIVIGRGASTTTPSGRTVRWTIKRQRLCPPLDGGSEADAASP